MAQIANDEEKLKEIKGQKTQSYATIKTIKQQLEMMRETTALGYNTPFGGIGAGNGTDYRIEQLQAKIDELLLVYNDQYPTVVKLRDTDRGIEEKAGRKELLLRKCESETDNYNPVEDPIYVDLKMRMNTAQSDLNALVAKEKELMASIDSNQALLRNFPKDKKTLNDLDRERAMQSAIYEQLLQRVGVSEVSKADGSG